MAESTETSFDIIFAGGGTAACITAGRLAEADPNLKILILEAGPHTKNIPEHVQPGLFFSGLVTRPPKTFTLHQANPSEKLAGRSVIVPTGRCVGGASSINFMVYCRAAASDYDDWENVHGNRGWSSKYLIPLLRKAETYQAESTNDTHGSSGPIKVSFAKGETNVSDQFLQVALQYDKDRGPIDDLNGLYQCDGYGQWARFIDGDTGKRSDTAHHYIYNKESTASLTVLDRKRVLRILFEGDRAIGVEYVDDAKKHIGEIQTPTTVLASRLVVLSAGAFGTPAILERSGIGASQVLQKNDVKQHVDLPGVGENYMDHNLVFIPYFAAEEAETMDDIFRGPEEDVKPYVTKWMETGGGLMAQNGMNSGIRLRPTASDLKEIGPSFNERWTNYFERATDKPVMLMAGYAAYAGPDPNVPHRKYISIPHYSAYPSSVGRVHINSGLDPYAPLDFDPGFLTDESDVDILRWAYKHGREIARRMPLYRGEYAPEHPTFPPGSEAAVGPADGPVAIDAPPIRYTAEDNKAIDEFHRKFISTTWHSVGTCAMKSREKGGVVDEHLNVYGVKNLKIDDLSILPSNVGANTYNTAIAVGEKAAVIIAQDLGIKGVTESD